MTSIHGTPGSGPEYTEPVGWQHLWDHADRIERDGGLAVVNTMSPEQAFVWYNLHGIPARPAHPDIRALTLPKGYSFDDLGPLAGDDLARHAAEYEQDHRLRVAIPLGKAGGLWSIDADDLEQWKKLAAVLGFAWDDPGTAVQTTGDEGHLHVLWRRDGINGDLLKNGAWSAEFPALEVKGRQMIMAAPSRHESGRLYQWQACPSSPAAFDAALLETRRADDKRIRAKVRDLIAMTTVKGREKIQVDNVADFRDTLCAQLGTGSLTGVYQRANSLVVVPRFGESGYVPVKGSDKYPRRNPPAQIRTLTEKGLAGFVASRWWPYVLVGSNDTGWERKHIYPPSEACGLALAADPSDWADVPPLAGVTHIPLLRPDGTLLSQPGYDEATSLLYLPVPGRGLPLVPDRPTEQQAQQAGAFLRGIIRQFGWVSDADRANYLGAMIMPALRLAVPPPWPPLAVNAHERGSGKTYLSELLRLLYEGVMYAAPGGNDEEIRKLITSILAGTTGTVVVLDNAAKTVRSRHFASLFTNPDGSWRDRLLGTNESPGLPNDRLWVFNGNNMAMGGDLPRRVLWASIDPGVPKPHTRTDFEIRNFLGWARQNRAVILSCILCLGRFWAQAGMPAGSAARSDTFERYAASASGLLELSGLAQAGEFWSEATSRADDDADEEDAGWAGFLDAVWAQWGGRTWEAGDITAATDWSDNARQAIRAALPGDLANDLATGKRVPADVARSLGRWCWNHQGQYTTASQLRVKSMSHENRRVKLWAVEQRQPSS